MLEFGDQNLRSAVSIPLSEPGVPPSSHPSPTGMYAFMGLAPVFRFPITSAPYRQPKDGRGDHVPEPPSLRPCSLCDRLEITPSGTGR